MSRADRKGNTPTIRVLLAVTDVKDDAYYKEADLPFLPRVEDALAVGPGNDYMTVRAIYWHPKTGTDVWFETYARSGGELLQDGWNQEGTSMEVRHG